MTTNALLLLLFVIGFGLVSFWMARQVSNGRDAGDPARRRHPDSVDAGPTPAQVRDPVCGMRLDPMEAAEVRTSLGRTIYLCSPGCAAEFDRAPGRYLRPPPDPHPRHARHGGGPPGPP